MQITIHFAGNHVTKEVEPRTTVGSILTDEALQSVLGFSENSTGLINGVTKSNDEPLAANDVLKIETRAAAKAIKA